jgi:hypothetical protein
VSSDRCEIEEKGRVNVEECENRCDKHIDKVKTDQCENLKWNSNKLLITTSYIKINLVSGLNSSSHIALVFIVFNNVTLSQLVSLSDYPM